jgi:hypothetical protein
MDVTRRPHGKESRAEGRAEDGEGGEGQGHLLHLPVEDERRVVRALDLGAV